MSKPEAEGKPSEPANRKIPANLLLTPEESGDKVTERMYMHRIKEPLCKRINLSGGLGCNQVTLYIILSLSDKKRNVIVLRSSAQKPQSGECVRVSKYLVLGPTKSLKYQAVSLFSAVHHFTPCFCRGYAQSHLSYAGQQFNSTIFAISGIYPS